METLACGQLVPHFAVRTVDGSFFQYRSIWQRRLLVLVTIGSSHPDEEAARSLVRHQPEFSARATACVVTRDAVPGVPTPGLLVADRWGEIAHVAGLPAGTLPPVQDLLDWIDYVARRCPECEGEAR